MNWNRLTVKDMPIKLYIAAQLAKEIKDDHSPLIEWAEDALLAADALLEAYEGDRVDKDSDAREELTEPPGSYIDHETGLATNPEIQEMLLQSSIVEKVQGRRDVVMKRIMTRGQEHVLNAIKEYFSVHSVPPTIREIQEMVGHKSTNSIRGHLKGLELAGAIDYEPMVSRGVRLKEGYCPSCGRAW